MKTYQEKCAILADWKSISEIENRLFFAARNGAIAQIILDTQRYFEVHGFQVFANWKESSFGPRVFFEIQLLGKLTFLRSCHIIRDISWPKSGSPSDCTYYFENVGGSEVGRKPKRVLEFEAIVDSPEFEEFIRSQINGANYPFEYKIYSSF